MSINADQRTGLYISAGDQRHYLTHNETKLLEELNYEKAILHLPITFFLGLLMMFGITGNICVIHVYRTRYRKTSGSYFIMVLAILDLLNSALCIPWEIYTLCNTYFQNLELLCKIARFLGSFVYLSAGLTLVCVAFSRYFKIIKPLHCYSSGQAQSLAIVMIAVSLCVVWPQLVLSGGRTIQTRVKGLYGQECSINDKMEGTIYPIIFHSCLYGVFTLCFILMMTFYLRIICVVCTRKGKKLGEQVANRDYTPRSSASNISERSFGSSQNISVTSRSQAGTHYSTERSKSVLCRVGRTTRMLGLVTFVFLLGYVPFLTVQVIYLLGVGFQGPQSYTSEVIFELCMRSYFLSSAANPLFYSILNNKFRKESMVALKNVILMLPSWLSRHCKGHHGVT